MELERTFFVPAYRSPFKLEEDPHEIATAQQRVEMLRLAIEGHSRFAIEEYEVRRGGVSYTVDFCSLVAIKPLHLRNGISGR